METEGEGERERERERERESFIRNNLHNGEIFSSEALSLSLSLYLSLSLSRSHALKSGRHGAFPEATVLFSTTGLLFVFKFISLMSINQIHPDTPYP